LIAGKIWSKSQIPGQEGYNIEGNSSNDLLRKNYLVDQFYGSFDLFNHYHMPGEGNIRGFVNSSQRGADAMVSSSTEFVADKGLFENRLNISFSIFADAGIFWDKAPYHPWYPNRVFDRYLGNVGFGTRLNTKLFEKELFLRFDVPAYIFNDGNSEINFHNWIFSFQRSI
jgi:outer membrane protein assembly factor BamA